MDIKEIALKVGAQGLSIEGTAHKFCMLDFCSKEVLIEFAEALVAEIAKQNEPVVTLKSDDFGWGIWEDNLEHKPAGSILNLYTIPPTAEQIANETAEACAELADKMNPFPEPSAIGPEIRSGEWRKFVKEV